MFVNEFVTPEGKAHMKTVVLQRTFRDKEGQFQNSNSFAAHDIPKAMLVLRKAYEYLLLDSGGKEREPDQRFVG